MSFDHKAYQFDWERFSAELLPVLEEALAFHNQQLLRKFLGIHFGNCRNPYDGEQLQEDWESSLEAGDSQEIADFALTKYYHPDKDFGLGENWVELSTKLPETHQLALLGKSLAGFDPGRQGSYFQSPLDVVRSSNILASISHPALTKFRELLDSSRAKGQGIYVTF